MQGHHSLLYSGPSILLPLHIRWPTTTIADVPFSSTSFLFPFLLRHGQPSFRTGTRMDFGKRHGLKYGDQSVGETSIRFFLDD